MASVSSCGAFALGGPRRETLATHNCPNLWIDWIASSGSTLRNTHPAFIAFPARDKAYLNLVIGFENRDEFEDVMRSREVPAVPLPVLKCVGYGAGWLSFKKFLPDLNLAGIECAREQ